MIGEADAARSAPLRRSHILERLRSISAEQREFALVCGFFFLTSIVLTYPLATALDGHIDNLGDPLLNSWILSWYAHAIPGDLANIFDPPIFYPYHNTLLFTEHMLGSGLLAWPIVRLSGSGVLAHNVLLLATFFFCSLGAYLLIRRVTGSSAAGIVCGILFAFSPFRMAHTSHLHVLSLQWLPFSLYFIDLFIEKRWPRDLALGAGFLAFQTLTSYNYAFFCIVAAGIWMVVRGLASPRRIGPRLVAGYAAIALVVGAVNLPIVLRYFTVSQEMGFTRSADEIRHYSATLRDYLAAPARSVMYGVITTPYRTDVWSEKSLFPGAMSVILGTLGALTMLFPASRGKRSAILAFALIGLISMNLSLGLTDPPLGLPDVRLYPKVVELVPGLKGLRVTARAAGVALLGIAGLAGFGIALIYPRISRLSQVCRLAASIGVRPPAVVLAGLSLLAMLDTAAMPTVGLRPVTVNGDIPGVYRWLAVNPDPGAVIEVPTLMHTTEIWAEAVRMNDETADWRPMVNGYSGFLPKTHEDLSRLMERFPDEVTTSVLDSIGVRFVVVHWDDYSHEQQPGLEQGLARYKYRSLVRIDENEVFAVPDVRQADPSKLRLELDVPGELPGNTIRPSLYLANSDSVIYVPDWNQAYHVTAQWSADGTAVLSNETKLRVPTLVAPGDEAELSFILPAPPAPGTYTLRLIVQGELARSGFVQDQIVRISPLPVSR